MFKNGWDLLDHMRLFDELSRLTEWFLHADSDSIIFDLITNLLLTFVSCILTFVYCIFDICWVSAAVLLVKNDVLLLLPTGKAEFDLSFGSAVVKINLKLGEYGWKHY